MQIQNALNCCLLTPSCQNSSAKFCLDCSRNILLITWITFRKCTTIFSASNTLPFSSGITQRLSQDVNLLLTWNSFYAAIDGCGGGQFATLKCQPICSRFGPIGYYFDKKSKGCCWFGPEIRISSSPSGYLLALWYHWPFWPVLCPVFLYILQLACILLYMCSNTKQKWPKVVWQGCDEVASGLPDSSPEQVECSEFILSVSIGSSWRIIWLLHFWLEICKNDDLSELCSHLEWKIPNAFFLTHFIVEVIDK